MKPACVCVGDYVVTGILQLVKANEICSLWNNLGKFLMPQTFLWGTIEKVFLKLK